MIPEGRKEEAAAILLCSSFFVGTNSTGISMWPLF